MEETKVPEHDKCLISASNHLSRLKGYEKAFLVKSPIGFVFSSRVPSEAELINHYKQYSRDGYVSPLTIKRYNDLLDSFEKFRIKGKILDIGCGVGKFLIEAKKRGWEVYGTEFTSEAIDKCESEGIKMNRGKLDPTWFQSEMFDVITSFEVIEHINNPLEEIKNIHSILRKGGLLYITTPNFNATERFLLKDKYTEVIQYPEHLSYYTRNTLHYLLSRNGFEKFKVTTTGISITRIKLGLSLKTEKFGSPVSTDETLRGKLEVSPLLRFSKTLINSVLNFFGVGNALKAWYIKN